LAILRLDFLLIGSVLAVRPTISGELDMSDGPLTKSKPGFERHMRDPSLREKALEHLFVGDLLRHLWCQGITDVEFLTPGVDRDGYDLVLESNGIVRHIQLKSRFRGSSVAEVDVHINLPKAGWVRDLVRVRTESNGDR
jgi:hypothetical protein